MLNDEFALQKTYILAFISDNLCAYKHIALGTWASIREDTGPLSNHYMPTTVNYTQHDTESQGNPVVNDVHAPAAANAITAAKRKLPKQNLHEESSNSSNIRNQQQPQNSNHNAAIPAMVAAASIALPTRRVRERRDDGESVAELTREIDSRLAMKDIGSQLSIRTRMLPNNLRLNAHSNQHELDDDYLRSSWEEGLKLDDDKWLSYDEHNPNGFVEGGEQFHVNLRDAYEQHAAANASNPNITSSDDVLGGSRLSLKEKDIAQATTATKKETGVARVKVTTAKVAKLTTNQSKSIDRQQSVEKSNQHSSLEHSTSKDFNQNSYSSTIDNLKFGINLPDVNLVLQRV